MDYLGDGEKLLEYLNDYASKNASAYIFVFLDEIQSVSRWPGTVETFRSTHYNASVFVTGSNSALLAVDKERVLGGPDTRIPNVAFQL